MLTALDRELLLRKGQFEEVGPPNPAGPQDWRDMLEQRTGCRGRLCRA
jgi:hypothetical protein